MDGEIEYVTQIETNNSAKKLDKFINNKKFITPKGCGYTNIINQRTGSTYYIPFPYKDKTVVNTLLEENSLDFLLEEENMLYKYPIDAFFEYLEATRIRGVVLGYCERQTFSVPIKEEIKTDDSLLAPPNPNEIFSEHDIDNVEEFNVVKNDKLDVVKNDVVKNDKLDLTEDENEKDPLKGVILENYSKSCIELDFDIYQKETTRIINQDTYKDIIDQIANILRDQLDFGNLSDTNSIIERKGSNITVKFYIAILCKKDIRDFSHPIYGKCSKDSFHIRIFLKVSKEYKKHLINTINEKGILQNIFSGITILSPINKIIDPQSTTFPCMMLGSVKRSGNIPHEFHSLYLITLHNWPNGGSAMVRLSKEFDPINSDDIGTTTRKKKKIKPALPKYKYNLCYELSINYENRLILKREVDPLPSVIENMNIMASRTEGGLISNLEIEEIRNQITDLTVTNSDARYIQIILEILKPERTASFEDWKSVIIILAHENPSFKCLAIWFSQRCPQSWVRGGMAQLESIWEWALNHRSEENGRTIKTLYAWAKEDDPVKFAQAQEFNSFNILRKMIFRGNGSLTETDIAIVLKRMFGLRYICDENPNSASKGKDRKWYEFIFPVDEGKHNSGQAYKWRFEKYPDNLDKYISHKMPDVLRRIKEWIETKCEETAEDEAQQKWYSLVDKNLNDTIKSLGKQVFISHIISRCEIEFRDRGFLEDLDKDPLIIGVGNGVLKLRPQTELIQRYHEIPISRTTKVDYINENIDPLTAHEHRNPYIRKLWIEIKRLFAGDEEAFIFVMCYLASSLDGCKKTPLFFIWLGEGSNGKSFLLELHIKVMNEVVNKGYAAKMNVAYFTKETKASGPDSEKMMLKNARFAYCSESEAGDTLRMGRIKEFTSETISGNEKFQQQEMFEANCRFVCASNYDPRITGSDYGTWRRILVYLFKMKFRDNPDPADPHEYKNDPSLVNDVPGDIRYRQAYLSILVYFYNLYRDKYNYDLSTISKKTIDAETLKYRNDQDTISRYITEQIAFIGDTYPDTGERVEPVLLVDLTSKYSEWHKRKIDNVSINNIEIIRTLRQSSLKKLIKKLNGHEYLTQCRVLNIGEVYSPNTNPIPNPDDIPDEDF